MVQKAKDGMHQSTVWVFSRFAVRSLKGSLQVPNNPLCVLKDCGQRAEQLTGSSAALKNHPRTFHPGNSPEPQE